MASQLDPAVLSKMTKLQRIEEALSGEAYFIQTIFNPLSIAADMVSNEQQILDDMKNNPQALKDALEVITETFTNFARECVKEGACGIFFATTEWASRDRL